MNSGQKPLKIVLGSSFFVRTTNDLPPRSATAERGERRSSLAYSAEVAASATKAGRSQRLCYGGVGTTNRRRGSCRAFSLIEVTLALMVISVGMLSVIGLFPLGLDQNSRAIADTHAALFADEVLSGLRACAADNWAGLDDSVELPVAAEIAWINSGTGDLDPGFTVPDEIVTNIYYVPNGIVDHAFRFRLNLTSNGNVKAATLWVWSGEFGTTSAPSIFYEEFFKMRP